MIDNMQGVYFKRDNVESVIESVYDSIDEREEPNKNANTIIEERVLKNYAAPYLRICETLRSLPLTRRVKMHPIPT